MLGGRPLGMPISRTRTLLGLLIVEFGVLGPIAAWSKGKPLSVGGPRQRCVLGALLVQVGREVTFDQLIGYLWSDDPPRTARSVIQVQISHLRRSFPEMIRTTSGGYLADIDPEKVDLYRFRSLRVRAEKESPATALALLTEALECWRGVPFSGVGSEHLYYSVVSPLLEERWSSVAEWGTRALELGRANEVVTHLTPLAREEPLRERIHHLLITALWHSGERASALAAYEKIRSRLAEELGVDPDPELAVLHTQILRADTWEQTSDTGRAAPPARDQGFVVRNDLPRDIPDFTGRDRALTKIFGLARRDESRAKICVLTGSGGVGKTTVAVRAGHELADEYVDGQLFIDLYGYTLDKEPLDSSTALGVLLRAVGVDPESIPENVDERSALWRATLMGRRLLVVLDNAVSYAQVSPLLASSKGSLTLVTSRNDLSGLSGAHYVSLGVLGEDASLELFARILGEDKVEQEPEDALRAVRMCGGLPLALRVVAARMLSRPRWTFTHVVRRLSEQSRRFQELRVDGQSVEVAIDLSYQSLNADLHRAFLLLSAAFGRHIDLHGAAALIDMSPEEADEVLQDLVGVCLLDEPHADVYRFHDLVRDFAVQRARHDIGVVEYERARDAHARYFTVTTNRAAELLGGPRQSEGLDLARYSRYHMDLVDRSQAEAWFELHQDDIADVVDYYATHERGDEAWRIADSAWRFYAIRGQTGMLLSLHEKALAANDGSGHERGRAVTLIGMGIAYCISGHFDRSLEMLTEAKRVLEVVNDEWGMFRALSNLAMVYERVGRLREAAETVESLLSHKIALSDPKVTALQWGNLAILRQSLWEHDEAIRCAERAVASATGDDVEETRAHATRVMGEAMVSLGRLPQALKYLDESLELALRLKLVGAQIFVHNSFGIAYRAAEKWAEAVAEHNRALELAWASGDRNGEAEIFMELGVTHMVSGHAGEASEVLEKALVIATERNERYMAARASLALGRIPEPVMKAERARELLTEALRAFEDLDLPEAEQAREALQALDS